MIKYIVMGTGISGQSMIDRLRKNGESPLIWDDEKKSNDDNIINDMSKVPWENIKYIAKSPGIKPSHPLILNAIKRGINVISDVELAYILGCKGTLVAITGTNGKTTTTTLVNEILNKSGFKAQAVGNIGVGLVDALGDDSVEDVHVMELSSFQLTHVHEFKPKVAAITNITPDHLDWHGSFENYVEAKLNIAGRKNSADTLVLNYDDEILRKWAPENSNIIYFSVHDIIENGFYLKEDSLYRKDSFGEHLIINRAEVPILGMHNVENVLCAAAICHSLGVNDADIYKGIKEFKAVSHRIEPSGAINGVEYYNDSKGTNPEASIKAIEAMGEKPIILFAGGYDKGSDYGDYAKSAIKTSKLLITMGQTAEAIEEAFIIDGFDFEKIIRVKSMAEALDRAYENALPGDVVLLSPACASWGMYDNYEQRGNEFKDIVKELRKRHEKPEER
ncbi:MAG: UDP-N-acetylmuramoyl-L-alanine--D-glutamate ligase [Tissierellia bacterium]|nr:UDP-N-acetylmuramoyl-L-alanine--D-glutamate ligase [Tissierellia bacterium]